MAALCLPGQGSGRRPSPKRPARSPDEAALPHSPHEAVDAAQPVWDEAVAAARPLSVDQTATLPMPSGKLRLPSVARAPACANNNTAGMRVTAYPQSAGLELEELREHKHENSASSLPGILALLYLPLPAITLCHCHCVSVLSMPAS